MSNLEKVQNALMLFSLQYGYPLKLSSSDLKEFIEANPEIPTLTSSQISTVGRDNEVFIFDVLYQAKYLGYGKWEIVTIGS